MGFTAGDQGGSLRALALGARRSIVDLVGSTVEGPGLSRPWAVSADPARGVWHGILVGAFREFGVTGAAGRD